MTNRGAASRRETGCGSAAALLLLAGAVFAAAAGGTEVRAPGPAAIDPTAVPAQQVSGSLRVLTLNVAHGRNQALNQVLLSRTTVERNLTEIAALLREAGADVVALQEADGPSRWSGGFDHVATLAGQANYAWQARASHAKSRYFDYGTALLARVPFSDRLDHAFQPTPPSMTKGLTLGRFAWRPSRAAGPIDVDVVSVHLDFSRDKVRRQQVAEMAAVLSARTGPMIVLGDLNDDWSGDGSIVTELARRCGMQAWQAQSTDLATHPSSGRRLDWILISGELEFLHHEVLPHAVSDHRAVVADIELKATPDDLAQAAGNSRRCGE